MIPTPAPPAPRGEFALGLFVGIVLGALIVRLFA
jgi:hypothetical protein